MPEMSLSEAAKWAGVTRATIHKALKGGRLSGRKDESGEWRIDPAELERVYPPGKPVDASVDDGVSSSDTAELTALMAAKDREIALLREALEDARMQRDRAMALAEAQTRLLAHHQQQERQESETAAARAPRPRFRLGWWRQ